MLDEDPEAAIQLLLAAVRRRVATLGEDESDALQRVLLTEHQLLVEEVRALEAALLKQRE